MASWSAISRGATASELLIYPTQLTTNPDSECPDRYTARVESRTDDRLTIALVQRSERPRDLNCAGEALTGPPVVVTLDAPYAGEKLVDAASGRVEKLAPRGTYETPPAKPSAEPDSTTDRAEDLGFQTSPPGLDETGPPE